MTAPYSGRLTGHLCQCPACGHTFGGERGFDLHRVGGFAGFGAAVNNRRCLTDDEMRAAGLMPDERGIWRRPRPSRFAAANGESQAPSPHPLQGHGTGDETPALVPSRQAAA